MSFDQPLFLPFALLTFVVLRIAPRLGGMVLLASSLGFYLVAGWHDLVVVACLVLANYLVSLRVRSGRSWLVAAIGINLAPLLYFKYRTFLFGELGAVDVFSSEILIPLGLSFYVFQFIAYQVDIFRRRIEPTRSLLLLALFILFFPHQVAGPIMRGHELIPQLAPSFQGRTAHRPLYGLGLALCLLGLVKKIVFADSLAPFADEAFALGPADALSAWLAAALFTFQIYFDFSGYSDIAVGLGYILGVHLPYNFRQPYLALTPQEFWRRWHITLSSWIRDYLYIPMGGRRGGWLRQAAVLVVTMALAGLWHGANWTFVLWGIGWGCAIALWRLEIFSRLGWLQWALTFLITILLWVPFRASDVDAVAAFFAVMFALGDGGGWQIGEPHVPAVAVGLILLLIFQWGETRVFSRTAVRKILRCDGAFMRGLCLGLIFWLMMLPRGDLNPFIYFRF